MQKTQARIEKGQVTFFSFDDFQPDRTMSNPELFESLRNAVEQLANQNESIDEVLDKIVEHVSNQPGANNRSDWEEIVKTAESLIVGDLTFGTMGPAADPPCQSPNIGSTQSNDARENSTRIRRNPQY